MKSILVLFDAGKERFDFEATLALAPVGEPCAQMQAEQPNLWCCELNFEKRVAAGLYPIIRIIG